MIIVEKKEKKSNYKNEHTIKQCTILIYNHTYTLNSRLQCSNLSGYDHGKMKIKKYMIQYKRS